MSLRNRLFVTLTFIFALYISIIYTSVRYFLYSDFERLEQTTANKNLVRGIQSLNEELDHLKDLAEEQTRADKIIEFIQKIEANHQAPEITLLLQYLNEAGLDEVFYFKTAKGPFYLIKNNGRTLDFKSTPIITPELATWLPIFESQVDPSEVKTGLWNNPAVIRLLAGRWITQATVPVPGLLILSKTLSDDLMAEFRIRTHVLLSYWNPLSPNLSLPLQEISSHLKTQQTSYMENTGKNKPLNLYTAVFNMDQSKPALILQAETPKDITKEGERTMWVIFAITVLSAPFSLLIMTLLVQIIGKAQ